jgi:two-component system OmpR family response regulator
MLTTLLGRNYETKSAAGLAATMELARREHFDLYILDNRFPDGTGPELCRRLRGLHPETPIIFYSGAVYESDKAEGICAGAQEYIAKPDIDGLTEAVRRVLINGTEADATAD